MASSNTSQQQHTNQTSNTQQNTRGGSTSVSGTTSNGGSVNYGESHQTGKQHQEGGSKSVTAATGQVSDAVKAGYDRAMSGYKQSEAVKAAYNKLQEVLNSKPGAFSSKYTESLDNIYNQIMDRPGFSYNMNNDAMYNIYKDLYQQQGKSAMRDTVAQSAALTGGYNNSYATTAGSQAYQAYLERLNEMVPQLQQNAYNMYRDETSNMFNKANLTQNLYQQDYGQYRDTVGDWKDDRNFYYNNYKDERAFDYGMYGNDRSFYSNEYWNQRNAEKTNTANNWSDSNSSSDTVSGNWTTNWNNSQTSQWTNNWSDTNSTTNTTSDSYSNSSTESGGSGGSSGGSSGSKKNSSGNSARSGATLDKAQRDKITLEALDNSKNGGSPKAYLQKLVEDGVLTYEDYNYMTGTEEEQKKSDAAYVALRRQYG